VKRRLSLLLIAALGLLVLALPASAADPAPVHAEGVLADGALWTIDKPTAWNGVLLVWSHGYAARLGAPEDAPRDMKTWALAQGYALAASSYARPGWALEQAAPDQVGVMQVFAERFGQPRRTIAWGDSMGGLVTTALAEQYPGRLSGAVVGCGSIGGAVGMMNMALDGAFAFKTLLAPGSDIALVRIADDRANAARVQAVIDVAQTSPAGRARMALASALAQEVGWTDPNAPEPAADDFEGREAQAARSFAMGVFLPRSDQELRAGGVFSWNTGVDYADQLRRSGQEPLVRALYAKANLDLGADLAVLAQAPRIAADPAAVAYMAAHYSPSGDLRIPMLTLHTVGDGLTSPANEAAYAETTRAAGRSAMLAQVFVKGAGHCAFTPAERGGALKTLEARLDDGRWSASVGDVQARSAALNLGAARFIDDQPPVFLRPFRPAPHDPAPGH
jgi:pimeloyl-ACP methyl ester carboxylesterase